MDMILWICIICVAGIIASVTFCRPYLSIAFIIVSIPFEGVIDLGYISIYPLEAILAISVLVYLYKSIVARSNYPVNMKLVYGCIPFFVCIMLSTMKSIAFSSTAKEVVRWLELFLIYYLTINLINDKKEIRIILYSMFSTVAIVSALEIINYLRSFETLVYIGERSCLFFGNPNPFAGYVNLVIPVLLGMMMASALLWEKLVLGTIAVLSIIALGLLFSKSGYLSLVLTIVFVFLLIKAKKEIFLVLATLFVISTIILLFAETREDFIGRVGMQQLLTSLRFRAMCYPIGFNMVNDNIALGIGIGNYPLLITTFTKNCFLVPNHLHSLYLQVFVETGIIGLSAFLFWLVCMVKYLVSSLKVLEKNRNYCLFVGLVGGAIIYLFNNLIDVIVVHGIHLQWGIILGLAVALTQFRETETCLKTV